MGLNEQERELIVVESDFIHNLKDLCLLLSERQLQEAIQEKERLHQECSNEHIKGKLRTKQNIECTDESQEAKYDTNNDGYNADIIKDDKMDVKLEIDHELDVLDNWNEQDSDASEDSVGINYLQHTFEVNEPKLSLGKVVDSPKISKHSNCEAIEDKKLRQDASCDAGSVSTTNLCILCDVQFSTLDELQIHYTDIHPEDGQTIICPKCTFSALERHDVLKHICSQHLIKKKRKTIKKEQIFCPYCSKFFRKSTNLNRHINMAHGKVEGGRKYASHSSKKEKKKQYQCSFCDHEMGSKARLKEHINAVHTKDKNYKCDKCDFTSNYSRNLVKH